MLKILQCLLVEINIAYSPRANNPGHISFLMCGITRIRFQGTVTISRFYTLRILAFIRSSCFTWWLHFVVSVSGRKKCYVFAGHVLLPQEQLVVACV